MKKNKSHIVLACFLLASLFFTQIAANFLHDDHCERYHSEQKDANSKTAFKADEECTICSLDLFHEFVFSEVKDFLTISSYQSIVVSDKILAVKTTRLSSSGRSPPVC